MAVCGFLVSSLILSSLVETCYGVTFSSLQSTLVVTASPTPGQVFGQVYCQNQDGLNAYQNGSSTSAECVSVLKAGQDQITVTWSYNQTYQSAADSTYKTIKIKLCYAPISQVDRSWRKTVDDLNKDKTCQFNIISKPYNSTSSNNSFTWTIGKDIPTATYFVRAYAYTADGVEAAYGQSTNAQKTTNLFEVEGISGRHVSLDVASICFSAFSILALFGFFYVEKRKAE